MGPERDLDAHACVSCLCACCSHPGRGRSNGRAECVVWTEGSLRMITGRFWKFSPVRAHLYPTQEDPRRGLLAPQIPMDDAREGYIPKLPSCDAGRGFSRRTSPQGASIELDNLAEAAHAHRDVGSCSSL